MKSNYYGRIRTEFPSYREAKLHQATHGGYIMEGPDGRCLHYALGYTRSEALSDAARTYGRATCRTFGFNEPNGYDGEIEREFLARRNMPA